jgi:hypothetical protein
MRGKILLCIYEFPVSTSLAIRWFEYVKYLSNQWDIIILTNKPSETYCPLRNLKFPPSVHIIYTPPGLIYKISRTGLCPPTVIKGKKPNLVNTIKTILRSFFRKMAYTLLVPDPTIEWILPALKTGKNLLRECDIIISTGPPLTPNIICYYFKKWSNKPWIVFMADPWALSPQRNIPFWRRPIDKKIEGMLLKEADKIVLTTEKTKEEYLKHYPFLSEEKLEVITGGFPERLHRTKSKLPSRFRIVYTGVFYEDIRSPSAFFEALKMFKRSEIEVVIAGPPYEKYVKYVQRENLPVTFLGYVPYEHALKLQEETTVLLLIGNVGGLQIPRKIFEYIGARRPILAIRMGKDDLAANLVEKLNRGIVVENDAKK